MSDMLWIKVWILIDYFLQFYMPFYSDEYIDIGCYAHVSATNPQSSSGVCYNQQPSWSLESNSSFNP